MTIKLIEFEKIKFIHLVEIISVIYMISTPPWAAKVLKSTSTFSSFDIMRIYIQLPIIIGILLIIVRKFLGSNDYRYKIVLHSLLAFVTVTLSSLFSSSIPVVELSSDVWMRTLIFTVPVVIHIVAFFKSLFVLSDPFVNEFEYLKIELQQNNIKYRFEDEKMINDFTFGRIANYMNEILDHNEQSLNKLKGITNLIFESTETLSENTETLSSAVEEVSASSQNMAQGAFSQTQHLQQTLDELVDANDDIIKSLNDIQSSTSNVNSIALQTNILALNAGIEASRAGDYGRGFAVVAENVRKLSDQTKQFSDDINAKVENVILIISTFFTELQQKMDNISVISEETSASSEEVAATMEEISSNLSELSNLGQDLLLKSKEGADHIDNIVKN